MKGKTGKIAIYSRKSKFTGKGESIGNQIELCKEFIRLHYAGVMENDILVFEDEGFSGGNLDRPDFKRMMKAARAHAMDAIVVYRLDRISRNISDFSTLIEELGGLNIAFISIREQFDTASPMGRGVRKSMAVPATGSRRPVGRQSGSPSLKVSAATVRVWSRILPWPSRLK